MIVILAVPFVVSLPSASGEPGARSGDEGLVALWDFDEGNGTVLHDRTGNNNNGIIHGATWTAGINGSALYFDGINDCVEIPDSKTLNFGTGSFSYSMWVRIESISHWSQLLCKRFEGVHWGGDYELQIDSSGRLEFIFGGETNYSRKYSTVNLNICTWYMITVVRGNGTGYLYIDDRLDVTLDALQNVSTPTPLMMATDNYLPEYFNGIIDDVRIYDRALNMTEVKSNYREKVRPDLSVSPMDISFSNCSPVEKSIVDIAANVHNLGNADACDVAVRFLDDGGRTIKEMTIPCILPNNGTARVTARWVADPAGWHNITVHVDPNDLIYEADEDNNIATRMLLVVPVQKPDLMVSPADISFSSIPPIENDSIDIAATVHNIGTTNATNAVVIFLDGNAQIGADAVIPFIPASGGFAQLTTTWKATSPGLHDIAVWVDPFDTVNELNESNNRANRTIMIGINEIRTNHPPRFVTTPQTNATVGLEYSYMAQGTDEDGDQINYSFIAGIERGMTFHSANGSLNWTPCLGQEGDHRVILCCSDGRGGSAEQSFIIHVDLLKPLCRITSPRQDQTIKGVAIFQGTAVKGAAELRLVRVRFDNGAWKNASGTANWSFELDTTKMRNGVHSVEAQAFDDIIGSEIFSVSYRIGNRKSGVTVGELPWCQAVVILLSITIAAWIVYRRQRRKMQHS